MTGVLYRILSVFILSLSSLTVEGAVGKLVAGGMVLQPGEEWLSPADSLPLLSAEVRGRVLPGERVESGDSVFWNISFYGRDGRKVLDVFVTRPGRNVHDDYLPEKLSVMARGYDCLGNIDGELWWDNTGRRIDSNSRMTVSVAVSEKGMARIMAGDDTFFQVGSVPLSDDVVSVSVRGNSRVEICSVNLRTVARVPAPEMSGWNYDTLAGYFAGSDDRREGFYEYLDSDIDTERCVLGGRYRLAVVGNGAGGYDIVYLGGAEENAASWLPGLIKGTLTPTIFINHYNLRWFDAEMTDDMPELWGTLDGTIMELHFPQERTVVRFSRSRQNRR